MKRTRIEIFVEFRIFLNGFPITNPYFNTPTFNAISSLILQVFFASELEIESDSKFDPSISFVLYVILFTLYYKKIKGRRIRAIYQLPESRDKDYDKMSFEYVDNNKIFLVYYIISIH